MGASLPPRRTAAGCASARAGARAAGAVRARAGARVDAAAKAAVLAATLLLTLMLPAAARAHAWTFTGATATLEADTYQVDLVLDLNALMAGAAPGHLEEEAFTALLALTEEERQRLLAGLHRMLSRSVRVFLDGEMAEPELTFPEMEGEDGRPPSPLPGFTARFTGPIPEAASTFALRASARFGPLALAVRHGAGGPLERFALAPGEDSPPIPLDGGPAGTWAVAWRYLKLGFIHILPAGLDHILFVLGLFFLSTRLRPLLAQVTAFTVAHTATLALSIFDVVSLPSSVVEPLIALSIVYVAVENLVTSELKPWRPVVVFGFGLLHGLGFAGVLRELGLPRGGLVTALLSFNVGVELGQLAVIALAFAAVGWLRPRAWYRRAVTVPASLLIAAAGLAWAVERTMMR